jgi:hypothetical protein
VSGRVGEHGPELLDPASVVVAGVPLAADRAGGVAVEEHVAGCMAVQLDDPVVGVGDERTKLARVSKPAEVAFHEQGTARAEIHTRHMEQQLVADRPEGH